MTELHKAVSSGNVAQLIKVIMKDSVDVNAKDKKGRTALHVACKRGSKRLTTYLIRFKGADMRVRDMDGKTPLELTPPRSMRDMTLLFSKEEARRQSKQRRSEKDEAKVVDEMDFNAEEVIEEDDVVGAELLRKVFFCLILPLLILLLVNGWWFSVKFIAGTLFFYSITAGYFVTEISFRPPWYHQSTTNRDSLSMKGCPLYWQGWINDPETDFGLAYEDVHFRSTDGYTLRGWHVFPPSKSAKAKRLKDRIEETPERVTLSYKSDDRATDKSPESINFRSSERRKEPSTFSRERLVKSPENRPLLTNVPQQVSVSAGETEKYLSENSSAHEPISSSLRPTFCKVYDHCEGVDKEGDKSPAVSGSPFLSPVPSVPDVENRDVGIILVHGGGRDRRSWLRHIYFLHQAGYGCLLFDLREHGLSDGRMRGLWFGMRERYDVVAAADFMRHQLHYKHICLMGTSVGGSAVLMAAAIDKSIDGVISENPFTTCASLIDYQLIIYMGNYVEHHAVSKFFFKLFRRLCRFMLNCRIGNVPSKHCQSLHCIDSISPRPVMLLHGLEDSIVPYRHSQILYERAKAPKELYLFEKAYHCGLYNTSPEEYENRVLSFLSRLRDRFHESENLVAEKKTD